METASLSEWTFFKEFTDQIWVGSTAGRLSGSAGQRVFCADVSNVPMCGCAPRLQDALREKEEHIEQLLKERDLEQTEIARVTAYREEAEAKLHALQGN